jgi:hypothetical protein
VAETGAMALAETSECSSGEARAKSIAYPIWMTK